MCLSTLSPTGYGIYAVDFQTIYLAIYNNIVIIIIDYDTTSLLLNLLTVEKNLLTVEKNLLTVEKTYLLLKKTSLLLIVAYSFYSSATSLLLEVLSFMEKKRN